VWSETTWRGAAANGAQAAEKQKADCSGTKRNCPIFEVTVNGTPLEDGFPNSTPAFLAELGVAATSRYSSSLDQTGWPSLYRLQAVHRIRVGSPIPGTLIARSSRTARTFSVRKAQSFFPPLRNGLFLSPEASCQCVQLLLKSSTIYTHLTQMSAIAAEDITILVRREGNSFCIKSLWLTITCAISWKSIEILCLQILQKRQRG
jgi:hypothetical protein